MAHMSAEMDVNSLLLSQLLPFSERDGEGEGEGKEIWQHEGGGREKYWSEMKNIMKVKSCYSRANKKGTWSRLRISKKVNN